MDDRIDGAAGIRAAGDVGGAQAGLLSERDGWRVVCVDPRDDARREADRGPGPAAPDGELEFDDAVQLLRERRRAMGASQADALWFADPLHAWMTRLDAGGTLDRGSVVMLAAGMRETLAMRDALVVSVIDAEADEGTLVSMASRPHERDNVRRLGRMVEGTFSDTSYRPDSGRCGRGVAMLEGIVGEAPERFHAQPLAALAYLTWWSCAGGAAGYALRALALHPRCTLAAIVLAAEEHGITPAWAGGRRPRAT